MRCFSTRDPSDVSPRVMIHCGRTFSFYHAYLVMIVTPDPTFYKFMKLEDSRHSKISVQYCMYRIKMGVTGVGVYFICVRVKILQTFFLYALMSVQVYRLAIVTLEPEIIPHVLGLQQLFI